LIYINHVIIKWYGTACILLEEEGIQLLFDPFFSLNKKLFIPRIKEEFSQVNSILITHGHFDHITGIPSVLERSKIKPFIYCTAAPRESLISMGIEKDLIQEITPGNILMPGTFQINVLKSKHIVFDKFLVIKTLLNPRILINFKKAKYILKQNKICKEAGETVAYEIKIKEKKILLMGSLNLDDTVDYPAKTNLLILPLQGRSDICKYSMRFIDRLKPEKVLVTHYDNSFPPVSANINIKYFKSLMRKNFPYIPVIIPRPGEQLTDVL